MKNKEEMLKVMREKILKIIYEKGNLDSEIRDMDLNGLRRLHQILYEEAIEAGKGKFGENFYIGVLRKKIDNTFEHMAENMCLLPIDFCNRSGCDYYDPDCVTRKIKDQINTIIAEILNPTSIEDFEQEIISRQLTELEERIK